ncbi:MAG: hypothetical protein IJT23_02200, partial [Clostridia bacterium]|nr:hypothetical protein [Clostridia bacterium]
DENKLTEAGKMEYIRANIEVLSFGDENILTASTATMNTNSVEAVRSAVNSAANTAGANYNANSAYVADWETGVFFN